MFKTIKTKDEAMKLQIITEHVPVSVSIFSNVSDYDDKPIFLYNIKPDQLINEFIQTILRISLKLNLLMKLNIIILLRF